VKGHLRQRSHGKWSIVIDLPSTGKRRRKWHTFAGTKRQAQIECARLISELGGGGYIEPTKTTTGEFLERWLQHMRPQVARRTHERYAEIARKNVAPLIGDVPLSKLQPASISAAYAKVLAMGRRDGKGGLKPRTVHHMHRILRQALQQAVHWQILTRNPADAVKPPRVEQATMQTYDLAQTVELIDSFRGTRMLMPVLLAVLCGLRRGEIAALRWRNVDLTAGSLAIVESAEQTQLGIRYKQPKSGRPRTVALSGTMIEELRQRKLTQAQELLKLGLRLTDDDFVVAQADGRPLQPNSITHEWVRLSARTKLPRVRFHDLRHAHATHLLASGVHPKIASERLGHSKVGITLDLYSHVLPNMQANAVAALDAALTQARAKIKR